MNINGWLSSKDYAKFCQFVIALVRCFWVTPSGSVLAQVAFNLHFVRRVPVQYTYGDRSGSDGLRGYGQNWCHIVG